MTGRVTLPKMTQKSFESIETV